MKAHAVDINHVAIEVGDVAEAIEFYGRFLDFLDPWGNRVEITTYSSIQYTKAEHVFQGMGMAPPNR